MNIPIIYRNHKDISYDNSEEKHVNKQRTSRFLGELFNYLFKLSKFYEKVFENSSTPTIWNLWKRSYNKKKARVVCHRANVDLFRISMIWQTVKQRSLSLEGSTRPMPVAIVRWCSVKKVFLEISQNWQENTCARVSFLIKLQGLGFNSLFLTEAIN